MSRERKELPELKDLINLKLGPKTVDFHISYLIGLKLDMEVYLPSKDLNLQRSNVWTVEQERELILSVLVRRHIPRISLLMLANNTVQVIDGKQRITALIRFIGNKFSIRIQGEYYYIKDLPDSYRRRIERHVMRAYVVNEYVEGEITDAEKISWFKYLNFAGTDQDRGHMKMLEFECPIGCLCRSYCRGKDLIKKMAI